MKQTSTLLTLSFAVFELKVPPALWILEKAHRSGWLQMKQVLVD